MKMQRMSGSSDRMKNNKSSILLSSEENDLVFSLLGRKCQSMCTSVVQLFTTDSPSHSLWIKRYTGALCFIKDSAKRSYYIRLFCLMKNDMMWEQEMYDAIEIRQIRPYLLNFEGHDGLIALNFASIDEAEQFYSISTSIIQNRNRRREDRKSRVKRNPPPRPTPVTPPVQQNNESDESDAVTFRTPTSVGPVPSVPSQQQLISPVINSYSSDRKRNTRKLTKADIGMPTNFKHLTHVGWSAQKGFDLTGDDVETLKPFLEKAGVSDQQLKDRETRAFIYDFIQNHNVLESVKSENVYGTTTHSTKATTPPPVPSRHQNGNQRSAPPPPPSRNQAPVQPPPLPTTTPPSRGPPPTRPPPITNLSTSISSAVVAAPPPPPPPPPPPVMMPIAPAPTPVPVVESQVIKPSKPSVPDIRSDLMDSIRKGAVLRKVDSSTFSTGSGGGGSDSRSDLMSEIRHGVELRPASTRELNSSNRSSNGAGTDALADALRRALMERGRVIHSSDDDSDSSSENVDEWDD